MKDVKVVGYVELFKLEPDKIIAIDTEIYYKCLAEKKLLNELVDYISKTYQGKERDFAFFRLGKLVGCLDTLFNMEYIATRLDDITLIAKAGGKNALRAFLRQLLEEERKVAEEEKLEAKYNDLYFG